MNRGLGLGWAVGPGLKFDNIDGLGQDRADFLTYFRGEIKMFFIFVTKCPIQ